jgi:hypothetical protein
MLNMVSITFSIPEDTRKIMKEFPEVNWTHIVRSSIEEKAQKLSLKKELFRELEKERKFIDWSVELGRLAKRGRHKRLK